MITLRAGFFAAALSDGKLGSAAILLALHIAAPAWAAPIVCGPIDPDAVPAQTCNVTRDVSIFVGTLTVNGAPVAPLPLVWSSDQIASSLHNAILGDSESDPRLTTESLSPFVVPVDSMTWSLAEPDNLPSLLVAQGGILDATYGTGTLDPSAPALLRGPTRYTLQSSQTFIPSGNSDALVLVSTYYDANVTVYEQNATWTAPASSAIPEPTTAFLMLGGLAGLTGLRAMRRRVNAAQRGWR